MRYKSIQNVKKQKKKELDRGVKFFFAYVNKTPIVLCRISFYEWSIRLLW